MKAPSFCSAEYLEGHFKLWLEGTVPQIERDAVEKGMREYCDKFPQVIERGDSWPDIRNLAERNGFIKL